jgi:hypothetical protein
VELNEQEQVAGIKLIDPGLQEYIPWDYLNLKIAAAPTYYKRSHAINTHGQIDALIGTNSPV